MVNFCYILCSVLWFLICEYFDWNFFVNWLERVYNFNCFLLNCFWNWRYLFKRYCRYLFFWNNFLIYIIWFVKMFLFDWILVNRSWIWFFYFFYVFRWLVINVVCVIFFIMIVLYFFGIINYWKSFLFEIFGLENLERYLFLFIYFWIFIIIDMFKLFIFY